MVVIIYSLHTVAFTGLPIPSIAWCCPDTVHIFLSVLRKYYFGENTKLLLGHILKRNQGLQR